MLRLVAPLFPAPAPFRSGPFQLSEPPHQLELKLLNITTHAFTTSTGSSVTTLQYRRPRGICHQHTCISKDNICDSLRRFVKARLRCHVDLASSRLVHSDTSCCGDYVLGYSHEIARVRAGDSDLRDITEKIALPAFTVDANDIRPAHWEFCSCALGCT